MSTGRQQWKTAAFQRREEVDATTPDVVAGTCEAVTGAIRDIYAQDTANVRFEDLHRSVYAVVLRDRGEELYSAVEAAMSSEVRGLAGSLTAANGAPFLQELLAAWRRHTAAVSAIQNMLMHMDRKFVPATGRTPVRALGLGLWRDGVVRSEKVRPMLVEAVLVERGRAEAAEPGASDLLAGVTEMLAELGAEVCREFMDAPPVSS
ncbi:hypothetical protein ACQJBY_012409 [Aegilops geniculata]